VTLRGANGTNEQTSEPVTFEDFRALGDARFDQGDFEGAIAFYDEAIALHPHDDFVWSCRGASLAKLGRHAEAIESYDKAVTLSPATADLLWEKLNRIVVMAIGGACLGAAIAQLPGAIIVGLAALLYGGYISFSQKALRRFFSLDK
jgi:tetratricopeptide (TPR) repeat protein